MDTTDATKGLDVGPGSIDDAYNIPALDWEIANKRVSVILDPSRGPAELQAKLKALTNYPQLVAVSQVWKSTTFDELVEFSTKLGTFAATTVQSYLTVLGMIVDALVNGDTAMKTRLDDTVDGFVTAAHGFTTEAAALAPTLKAFDVQMSQSDISGGGDDPIWQAFSLNAGAAFDTISGRFQLIAQDLAGLKANVDQKIKDDEPIVVQILDLKTAHARWKSIGDMTAEFVANAPAQRKYLNGDW